MEVKIQSQNLPLGTYIFSLAGLSHVTYVWDQQCRLESPCTDNIYVWHASWERLLWMVGWLGEFITCVPLEHFLQSFGQIGRKSTLMITLTTMTIGGSFPYFLHPTPDLYPLLVIARWKLWKTTIFIKIAKVCLWIRPRRHLYEHLQSCDWKRRRFWSNAFWNFDRGSIFCRWSGGLLAVTGEQIVLTSIISRNIVLGMTEVQKISGSAIINLL